MPKTTTTPTKKIHELKLLTSEAMALWDLLDRIAADQTIEPPERLVTAQGRPYVRAGTLDKESLEPLRWVRDRLAGLVALDLDGALLDRKQP